MQQVSIKISEDVRDKTRHHCLDLARGKRFKRLIWAAVSAVCDPINLALPRWA
jgi:hypothetical protein